MTSATSSASGPEGQSQMPSEVPASRGHALVVESDLASSNAVSRHLSDFGFEVTVVTSGVDAVIASRRITPAVILIATELRDVVGVDLVTWLRSNRSLADVPVVAMKTSDEGISDRRLGVFAARLRKPISAAGVAKAIQEAFLRIRP